MDSQMSTVLRDCLKVSKVIVVSVLVNVVLFVVHSRAGSFYKRKCLLVLGFILRGVCGKISSIANR